MSAKRHATLVRFILERAVQRGEFTLASGQKSDYYIDGKYLVADPEGLDLVAQEVLSVLRDFEVEAIGGLEIGAIYISTAVSLKSFWAGKRLPQITVRKRKKEHGAQKLIEGLLPNRGGRIAVVDDVVTTGGSILQAIDAVEKAGCRAVVALSVVDRGAGAREALAARGVPYHPLVTIEELGLSNNGQHQTYCPSAS